MTTLVWDQVGERYFETGVDRGVLYPQSGSGVAWNGLVSLTENFNRETKIFYKEGVKYLESQIPGDFAASLKAFTYPDEFEACMGLVNDDYGITFHDQNAQPFGLSYRTRLGNDTDGLDYGYRIHLVYNVYASPDSIGYNTLNKTIDPIDFSWALTATPNVVSGHRPTAHVSFTTNQIPPDVLELIEEMLYGSGSEAPRLPTVQEIRTILSTITIVDNGDGTWTAHGPASHIMLTDPTTFQITEVNATFTDANTYNVSTTTIEP